MAGALEQWQLRRDAAELYERYLVPTVALHRADDVVARAHVGPADRLLDAACGTGVVARVAAERVGTGGRVVDLDLNPGCSPSPAPSGGARRHGDRLTGARSL